MPEEPMATTAPAATDVLKQVQKLQHNLRQVIRGKEQSIDLLLAALLARGHVLIEDLPGLGKTTLAKALARSIDSKFRRVQFTPDLLPTDILGGSIFNPRDGEFTFHEGPLFTNILLADEINRASPRTQSSLLEAMAESQVTIEGVRHALPQLFMVVATQNPIEFHGTYPLPEAQLDRFLIRMRLGYADAETEAQMLFSQQDGHPLDDLQSVLTQDEVVAIQNQVCRVHMAPELGQYIVDLGRATREHDKVQMGASPRALLGLFRLSQSLALMAGREHVLPEDIQACAVPVLAHRILLDTKARYSGSDKEEIVQHVLETLAVPT